MFTCEAVESANDAILLVQTDKKHLFLHLFICEFEALQMLGEIGGSASLRYAVQLLTPSMILAKTCGREVITKDDVKEIDEIFFDSRASAKLLIENADKYIS